MQPVAVRILHPAPARVGPLERALLDARLELGLRLVTLFRSVGADDAELVRLEVDPAASFGARLRAIVAALPAHHGLVLLGSGAIPLATAEDVRAFLEVAASSERRARANNRFSADVIAIGDVEPIRSIPDLSGDNALPRWLEEVAGFAVDDLRTTWRLGVDLDSPLDVLLAGLELPGLDGSGTRVDGATAPVTGSEPLATIRGRLDAVRRVARDRRAELVVAGRTSAATVAWLEASTASRTRALIEERGLRASSPEATAGEDAGRASRRPPRSVLGLVLEDRGAGAIGTVLAELGDAALVDTRVLLAHRLGTDERAWPDAEDRFASDLLLPGRIRDPWLRQVTASARDAAIPIVLGGHSLVGPGIRLALADRP